MEIWESDGWKTLTSTFPSSLLAESLHRESGKRNVGKQYKGFLVICRPGIWVPMGILDLGEGIITAPQDRMLSVLKLGKW